MARLTPALDRLNEAARAEYFRSVSLPDATGPGVVQGMTISGMLARRTRALAGTTSYLQRGSLARAVIPRLHNLDRTMVSRARSDGELLARATEEKALEGVGEEITANLLALVQDSTGYLIGVVPGILKEYSDADVGALFVELWHVEDDEFDPRIPGNDLDFNWDDPLPTDSDTPHNYLLDLVLDAVIARLLKRHGPELLLAWADAVDDAHR